GTSHDMQLSEPDEISQMNEVQEQIRNNTPHPAPIIMEQEADATKPTHQQTVDEQKKAASSQQQTKKSAVKEPKKTIPTHRQQGAQLTLAELSQKYNKVFKLHGPVHEKKVAFSFDDAPDHQYTLQ